MFAFLGYIYLGGRAMLTSFDTGQTQLFRSNIQLGRPLHDGFSLKTVSNSFAKHRRASKAWWRNFLANEAEPVRLLLPLALCRLCMLPETEPAQHPKASQLQRLRRDVPMKITMHPVHICAHYITVLYKHLYMYRFIWFNTYNTVPLCGELPFTMCCSGYQGFDYLDS